jgi:hypothetical protein
MIMSETYKAKIELVTSDDVSEFSALCSSIKDHDFYIKGNDEFGKPWQMNAKSFLGTLTLTACIEDQIKTVERNVEKAEMRNSVDWNTIYVESTYPNLYTLVEKFAR